MLLGVVEEQEIREEEVEKSMEKSVEESTEEKETTGTVEYSVAS